MSATNAKTQRRKSVGIRQVAKVAGVSPAAVSLAFSGKGTISSKLRQHILETAKDLRYEPNQWARTLTTGRTRTIGLLSDGVTNPFGAEWVMLMEEGARRRGYRVSLGFTDCNEDRAAECLAEFRRFRLDGVIIGSGYASDQRIHDMLATGMPVATPARFVDGLGCTTVEADFDEGIRQVVSYLHGLGHRRTVFLGGANIDSPEMQRTGAYRKYVTEFEMQLREDFIIELQETHRPTIKAFERITSQADQYTAIICYNDNAAFTVIRALAERGLRVPEDVSVTGFDDVPWCEMWQPRLTSVSIQMSAMVEATLNQLIDQIENGTEIRTQRFAPTLVVRDSCQPVPASS